MTPRPLALSLAVLTLAAGGACKARREPVDPAAERVTATAGQLAAKVAPAPATPTQAAAPSAEPARKVVVIHEATLDPTRINQDVAALAAAEAKEGRRLLVFFGASWCEACQELKPAFARENNRATFEGWSLVRIDVDRIPDDETKILGVSFDEIPYLFKLDRAGRVAGQLPPEQLGVGDGAEAVDKRLKKFLST